MFFYTTTPQRKGQTRVTIDIRNGGLGWDLISHIFVCLDWFWWAGKGAGFTLENESLY
jgi:hypothetical protein